MKYNKIALAVMCLLALTVCASAQAVSKKTAKKENAKLEQILKSRALEAQQSRRAKCHKCGEEIYDKYHQECAKGGHCQEFPEQAPQRDSSNEPVYLGGDPHNPDNWAVPAKKDIKKQAKPVCAECGEEIHSAGQHCKASDYTTLCSSVKQQTAQNDRSNEPVYLGGDPHNPDNWAAPAKKDVKKQAKPVCAECGEEIHSAGQHCKASDYTTLCSSVKETKKETRVENTYQGGDPHAKEIH